MKSIHTVALAVAIAVTAPTSALAADDHAKHGHDAKAAGVAAADMVQGEVRKIDKAAGKITLKHGEIKNLDMPAMTMVFQIKDPAMLDTVKAGDMVKFKVEKSGTTFVVTEMAPNQ
jgi:Cu(I)/Ag(I) efflux system periplasmic protein CusF